MRRILLFVERAMNMVYNIAVGQQTTLLELYGLISDRLVPYR